MDTRLLCEWCKKPNTRFGGSPYLADWHDMCIDCYQATYANHKDEILPFEMVERKAHPKASTKGIKKEQT